MQSSKQSKILNETSSPFSLPALDNDKEKQRFRSRPVESVNSRIHSNKKDISSMPMLKKRSKSSSNFLTSPKTVETKKLSPQSPIVLPSVVSPRTKLKRSVSIFLP